MNHDDRRRHPRIPVRLVVHFTKGDKAYRLQSENLSLGGIFLRGADEICVESEEVTLEVVVPAKGFGEERHRIVAVVVQRIAGSGAGLRFSWTDADGPVRAALEAFLDRAGMLNEGAIHEEYVGLATDAVEDA